MACILTIRVVPRSKKQSFGYDRAGRITAHVRSAPEGGSANYELIQLVADLLDIAISRVKMVSGMTSRVKRLEIDTGMSLEEVYRKLGLEHVLQTTINTSKL